MLNTLSIAQEPPQLEVFVRLLDSPKEQERIDAVAALVRSGEAGRAIFRARLRDPLPLPRRIEALSALRTTLLGLESEDLKVEAAKLLEEIEEALNPAPPSPQYGPLEGRGFDAGNLSKDWEIQKKDGVEAIISQDAKEGRLSSGALRIEKQSAHGEIILRSKNAYHLRERAGLTVRMYYRADDAPSGALLQMYVEDESGNQYVAGPEQGWEIAESQIQIINAPPGHWNKRVFSISGAPKERALKLVIRLSGNPSKVWLDDIAFPATPIDLYSTVSAPALEEAPALEQKKSPQAAKLQHEAERTRLTLDGKAVPPILYFSIRGKYGDYAGMEKLAGVRFMVSSVHLNDIQHPRYGATEIVWPRSGEFNFTTPIEWLDHVANNAPESNLILNFNVNWPAEWSLTNPEERWMNAEGEYGYGNWLYFIGFARELPKGKDYTWWPSPSSEAAIQAAEEGIRKFVEAIREKPYFHRVVGGFISGGHDGQFFTARLLDHSDPAKVGFRNWLRERYGSDHALQKAWSRDHVTFENAKIPNFNRLMARTEGGSGLFINPAREHDYADYLTFQSERGFVIRERLGKAFKDALAREGVTMTWQMGGGRGQGAERLFLNSKGLDMMVMQPAYALRKPGSVGGLFTPLRSSTQHGKLAIKELDFRTWFKPGGDEADALRLSAAMSLSEWQSVYRKEAAQMIASGHGYWLYDITPAHFRDPLMLEEIRSGVRAYEQLELANGEPFKPGVAFAYVDESSYWLSQSAYAVPAIERLEVHTFSHLKQSGVPFDSLFFDDLISGDTYRNYRIVFIVGAYRLNGEQRRAVREKLQRNGRIVIFGYGSGYLADDGFSEEAMRQLTGIATAGERTDRIDSVFFSEKQPRGMEGLQGLAGSLHLSQFYAETGGDRYVLNPKGFVRFNFPDSEAIVLAHYPDGKAAMAMKRHQDYTSISLGAPGLMDARLLNRLAREAKAPVLTEPGVGVEFNGRFLSLHGMKNGPVSVTLPGKSVLKDFHSGQLIGSGEMLTIPLVAGETRWFEVQPFKD